MAQSIIVFQKVPTIEMLNFLHGIFMITRDFILPDSQCEFTQLLICFSSCAVQVVDIHAQQMYLVPHKTYVTAHL